MGKACPAPPVKIVCGLLASGEEWAEEGRRALAGLLGEIDLSSRIIPFDLTSYYEPEMGPSLLRQFLSFQRLVSPEELAEIKLATNLLEDGLSFNSRRRVNLDPGYVDMSRLVLATTKDASWRVYLGRGIWAESTLRFHKGSFCPWEWTYPDYRSYEAIAFFNLVRETYRNAIRAA